VSSAATPSSAASASAPARATTSGAKCSEAEYTDENGNTAHVLDKVAMVFGQMNEPPGSRLRVGLSGLTMAEEFRDESGKETMIFVDNIFRFTQAGSEVSALLGRMPSAVGYQPTLSTEMGELQERITSTRKGAITSVQAIYVPADDLTDPAPATPSPTSMRSSCSSEASRRRASSPRSTRWLDLSTILDPGIIGERHYAIAKRVQQILQRYATCRTSSPSSAWTSLPKRTSSSSPAPGRSSASSASRSTLPRSSPASPASTPPRGHHRVVRAPLRRRRRRPPRVRLHVRRHTRRRPRQGREDGRRRVLTKRDDEWIGTRAPRRPER
jgi:hypothetical protein